MQVLTVYLTAKAGNKKKNLMEGVVLSRGGESSKDQLGLNKEFTKEVKSLEFNYVHSNGD